MSNVSEYWKGASWVFIESVVICFKELLPRVKFSWLKFPLIIKLMRFCSHVSQVRHVLIIKFMLQIPSSRLTLEIFLIVCDETLEWKEITYNVAFTVGSKTFVWIKCFSQEKTFFQQDSNKRNYCFDWEHFAEVIKTFAALCRPKRFLWFFSESFQKNIFFSAKTAKVDEMF